MDFKAEKLKEIFNEMMKTRRKDVKMYQMNKHLIDDAVDFMNDLEAMKDLRKRIQSDVKKEANRKELSGLFQVFPNGMYTLYNVILRIAWNFLETRENIEISTHPFYHINLDWF